MDESSSIFRKTPRRSRYSSYQSDYETAEEESDSSLYYSINDDEDNESDRKNKENLMSRSNAASGRHSLLGKCLLNEMSRTPRNEFNKRVSFNHLVKSTPSPAMTNKAAIRSQNSNDLKIDVATILSVNIDEYPRMLRTLIPQNDASLHLQKPSTLSNFITNVSNESNSSDDAATAALDLIDDTDKEQSLNNTVVANFINQSEARLEVDENGEISKEGVADGIGDSTSRSTFVWRAVTASNGRYK